MKTQCRLLVAGVATLCACTNLDGPGITGGMEMRIVFSSDASSSAVPLDSVFVIVDGIGNRDGVGWQDTVRTDTTVRSDSLLAGQYELALVGYASDQVDAFELDTIIVVAGINTPVSGLEWSDFFTTVDDIPSPTTDTSIPVSWQSVPGASGYVVEWDTVPGFATPFDLSTTETTAQISITNLGDYFVRVRATHNLVSGPVRFSDAVGFRVVTNLALRFDQQPPTDPVEAGTPFAVTVQARDSLDQVDTSFNGPMSIALTTAANGATLGGTLTRQASNGVATFDDISVESAGDGYTLTATTAGRTDGVSDPFDILAGPPLVLAFLVQPTGSTAGMAFQPSVAVAAVDAFGNVSGQLAGDISLSITPGTGNAAATLGGVTNVATQTGSATFADLSVDLAGSGYTLTASTTMSGVRDTLSTSFDITPAAASVWTFDSQPTQTLFGQIITPAVGATLHDAFGNVVTGCNDPVTVSILSGTGAVGATLSGTLAKNAAAGVVSFDDLSIDLVGAGYQLSISGCGIDAQSDAFDVTAVPHVQVSAVQDTIRPDAVFAVVATANDSLGSQDTTFSGVVQVGIVPGSGNPAATLGGVTSVNAVEGVATFGDLSIDTPGDEYRLVVTADGFPPDTTNAFDVVPIPTVSLRFVAQPSTSVAGEFMSPAVQVEAVDTAGNRAMFFTEQINLVITSGTGTSGATLFNNVVAANAGLANFNSLAVDSVGSGYTLTASGGGLSVESVSFDIAPGAASMLVFTENPTDVTAGVAITPTVQVAAQDSFGNVATDFTQSVTLAINGGTFGAALRGVTTNTAIAGVVSFPGINVDSAGTGYTLTASNGGVPNATSTFFDVNPGPGDTLVFATEPTNTDAGATFSPSVVVEAHDSLGNLATGFSNNVTVAITPGTGKDGATLRGTTVLAAVNGRAQFSDINIDSVGTVYTLAATSGVLAGATSNSFDITPGPPARLTFKEQPTNTRAGVSMTPAVVVAVIDAVGNEAPDFPGGVSVGITPGTGDPDAVLSGGDGQIPTGSRVVFDALRIDSAGTYSLTATAVGLVDAVSSSFGVSHVFLEFTQQPPTTAPEGSSFMVTVRARLGSGTATGFNGVVTLTLEGGDSSATLGGTTTATASVGVATFPGVNVDLAGTGYTLRASAALLVSGTSDTFEVTVATASLGSESQSTNGRTYSAQTSESFGNMMTVQRTPIVPFFDQEYRTNGMMCCRREHITYPVQVGRAQLSTDEKAIGPLRMQFGLSGSWLPVATIDHETANSQSLHLNNSRSNHRMAWTKLAEDEAT